MPTTHKYKISQNLLPTNQQGGIMNRLGDTSDNSRSLLKQGLGVNLYPLPFAKGGTLPKAQFGRQLTRDQKRSRAKTIAKRDLDLNYFQRRKKYGSSGLEKLVESGLRFLGPTGTLASIPFRMNDWRRIAANSEAPLFDYAVEAAKMLPLYPKALSRIIDPATAAKSAVQANNMQRLSTLGGAVFGDAMGTAGVISDMNGYGTGMNRTGAFLPDVTHPRFQGIPMRMVRQERRKLLDARDKYQPGGVTRKVTPNINSVSGQSGVYEIYSQPVNPGATQRLGRVNVNTPEGSRDYVGFGDNKWQMMQDAVKRAQITPADSMRQDQILDDFRAKHGPMSFKGKFEEGGEMGDYENESDIGPGRGKWARQFNRVQKNMRRGMSFKWGNNTPSRNVGGINRAYSSGSNCKTYE